MKRMLLPLLLLACTGLHAQENDCREKWKMDITTGVNIDLPASSDNPTARLLGTRNTCAPALDIRLTHLFSQHWGWYADMKIKIFEEHYDDNNIADDIMEALTDKFFGNIRKIHPAVHAGVVYGIESERWRIYPRIGIGVNCGQERNKSQKSDSEINIRSNGTTLCSEAGISTHYMLSKKTSLLLDVSYQQPLTKAKASITKTDNGNTARSEYRTSTFGRELNVSVGIGLHF